MLFVLPKSLLRAIIVAIVGITELYPHTVVPDGPGAELVVADTAARLVERLEQPVCFVRVEIQNLVHALLLELIFSVVARNITVESGTEAAHHATSWQHAQVGIPI